jgi:alpha-L-fucosidase
MRVNLLLSIGPRADGTIPDEVRTILLDMGAWLGRNGEAIYGTEPWTVSGEGPTQVKTGFATDQEMKPYTASDFRFTRNGENLYVISLACPADGTATVHALGLTGEARGKVIREVDLLGSSQKVSWLQTTDALNIRLPEDADCKYAFALRIKFAFPRKLKRRRSESEFLNKTGPATKVREIKEKNTRKVVDRSGLSADR